jgi:hypothetical protein
MLFNINPQIWRRVERNEKLGALPSNKKAPQLGPSRDYIFEIYQLFDHRNPGAAFADPFVFNYACDFGKNCPVPADAYVIAGKDFGTALADDYRSGRNSLAAVNLDTSPLALAVTAVL